MLLFVLLSLAHAAESPCPPGSTPATLSHAISSSLTLSSNDIPQRTRLCVDTYGADRGNQNATGRTFHRAWKNGQAIAIPEEALPQPYKKIQSPAKNARQTLSSGFSSQNPLGQNFQSSPPCLPEEEKSLASSKKSVEEALFEPHNSILAKDTEQATREIARQDLLYAVLEARKAIQDAAQEDEKTLSAPYRNLPFQSLGNYLERARTRLGETADTLSQARSAEHPSGLDAAENLRFQNLYFNARDKAELGLGAIQAEENRQKSLGAISPFAGLLAPKEGNPLGRTPELSSIFSNPPPLSVDGLLNRLIFFAGLPLAEQAALLKNLKLLESTELRLPDGRKKILPLLHNGYLFGAGATGKDCSTLASDALPPDIRKGRFTSLDFRSMWIYRRTGTLPVPPYYPPKRAEQVRTTAEAFIPINLYTGEPPATGDLLIHRLPWDTAGHVFIVRNFNARNWSAEVIEAAQSAGTIRERSFPLSTDPPDHPSRLLRPGLFALRLKPLSNSACQYKEGK